MNRARSQGWPIGAANLVAVLVLYFAVPVSTDLGTARLLLNLILTGVAVGTITTLLVRQASRGGSLDALRLVLLLELVVVAFALAYYVVAINTTGQFSGIETRIDALYFTMTTMATVGFGDVLAEGQVARALVTGHMVFNLVFIGLVGNHLRRSLAAR